MRWSIDLEDCLHEIEQRPEWLGDRILAQQIKFQRVIQKATLHNTYEMELKPTDHLLNQPIFYVQALQRDLQNVKAMCSPELVDNRKYCFFRLMDCQLTTFRAPSFTLLQH